MPGRVAESATVRRAAGVRKAERDVERSARSPSRRPKLARVATALNISLRSRSRGTSLPCRPRGPPTSPRLRRTQAQLTTKTPVGTTRRTGCRRAGYRTPPSTGPHRHEHRGQLAQASIRGSASPPKRRISDPPWGARSPDQSGGRGGAIRTLDLLNPIQVRYQAAPRPDRWPMVAEGRDAPTRQRDGLGAPGVL